jgi:hypothetical protein
MTVSISAQAGPMAVQVDALVTCMKSLLVPEMFKLDPSVPPIPFREIAGMIWKRSCINLFIIYS